MYATVGLRRRSEEEQDEHFSVRQSSSRVLFGVQTDRQTDRQKRRVGHKFPKGNSGMYMCSSFNRLSSCRYISAKCPHTCSASAECAHGLGRTEAFTRQHLLIQLCSTLTYTTAAWIEAFHKGPAFAFTHRLRSTPTYITTSHLQTSWSTQQPLPPPH